MSVFPSGRPNISVRVIPKIPATMVGVGGIGISKEDGKWTVEPDWSNLQLIAPGVLLDPTSKELWVRDPVTDVYYRMTLGGLGQALFWGTSVTPNLIAGGVKTFETQSGKDWLPGTFIQAFSQSVITNYMIGQVTAYVGTTLTVNVLAVGGSGTPIDWILVPSTLPGAGSPGATGSSGGLNYTFTAAVTATDPLSGGVGFNNTSIAGISEMRIHDVDRNGVSVVADILTWDDSTTPTNRGKVRVYSASNPAKFVIATINGPLVDNGVYTTFPLINPVGSTLPDVANCQVEFYRTGDIGIQGPQGVQGIQGIQGPVGPVGPIGPQGVDGSAGARFQWNTDFAVSDPGGGKVKINSGTVTSATQLFISEQTILAQDVSALIASWDDSTTTNNRGQISILSLTDPSRFLVYRITGALTDNGAWVTFPVTHVIGAGGLSLNEQVQISFSRTGDAGITTITGTFPEAPADGRTYGRRGDTVSWNAAVALSGDTMAGHLSLPTGPAAANAVRKDYVDAADATLASGKVAKAGDTMTGPLTQFGMGHWTPGPSGAGTWFDNNVGPDRVFLGTDGISDNLRVYSSVLVSDILSLSAATGKMILFADPTSALGAATKQYVDARRANRNFIINGGFEVDQRTNFVGGAMTATPGYINADRWGTYSAGTATMASVPLAQAGFPRAALIARAGGSTNVNPFYVGQVIESRDAIKLAGQTITLSFWANHHPEWTPAGKALNLAMFYGTGTDQGWAGIVAGSWTGMAAIISQPFTLTQVMTRYSATVAVPANATEIGFHFSATPVGTAPGSDWFLLTGVQLEIGPAATPFEHRSYGQELALCQRYFRKTAHGVGAAFNATSVRMSIEHQGMRVSPTASVTGAVAVTDVVAVNSTQSAAGVSIAGVSPDSGQYDFTNFSGLNTARTHFFINGSLPVSLSAEL